MQYDKKTAQVIHNEIEELWQIAIVNFCLVEINKRCDVIKSNALFAHGEGVQDQRLRIGLPPPDRYVPALVE